MLAAGSIKPRSREAQKTETLPEETAEDTKEHKGKLKREAQLFLRVPS